jgi:hypothetical protein
MTDNDQKAGCSKDSTGADGVKLDGMVRREHILHILQKYDMSKDDMIAAVNAVPPALNTDAIAALIAHADAATTRADASEALVGAVQKEADALRVLVAGLEPSRQVALEAGGEPITYGERLWAVSMRIDTALARLGGGE